MLLVNTETDPLTLDVAKAHLVVDITEDDNLIQAYIDATLEQVELYLHKKVLANNYTADPGELIPTPTDTLVLELDEVPQRIFITFDMLDGTGLHRVELKSDQYEYDQGLLLIPVEPAYKYDEVTVSTGIDHGAKAIMQARLLLIGNFYSFREDTVSLRLNELPFGVRAILDSITGASL